MSKKITIVMGMFVILFVSACPILAQNDPKAAVAKLMREVMPAEADCHYGNDGNPYCEYKITKADDMHDLIFSAGEDMMTLQPFVIQIGERTSAGKTPSQDMIFGIVVAFLSKLGFTQDDLVSCLRTRKGQNQQFIMNCSVTNSGNFVDLGIKLFPGPRRF